MRNLKYDMKTCKENLKLATNNIILCSKLNIYNMIQNRKQDQFNQFLLKSRFDLLLYVKS